MFLLFYGYNYSCYLASYVSCKPDLLWNDFITDDPTGQLPKKMYLLPRNRLFLFCTDQDTKANARLIPTKLNSVLHLWRCCSNIQIESSGGFEKRRTALLLFSSCPHRDSV